MSSAPLPASPFVRRHAKSMWTRPASSRGFNAVPYEIVAVSSEDAAHRVAAMQHNTSATGGSYWSVTSGSAQRLLLKLKHKCLVAAVHLGNKGTSEVAVSVGAKPGRHNLIQIRSAVRLPLNKACEVRLGYVPCEYICIDFLRGSPISVYSLRVAGVVAEDVHAARRDPLFERLVFKGPERLLYGPSLPHSLPYQDAAVARLEEPARLHPWEDGVSFLDGTAQTRATMPRRILDSSVVLARPKTAKSDEEVA